MLGPALERPLEAWLGTGYVPSAPPKGVIHTGEMGAHSFGPYLIPNRLMLCKSVRRCSEFGSSQHNTVWAVSRRLSSSILATIVYRRNVVYYLK